MGHHHNHFEEHGYVIIKQAIPEHILSGLRAAADILHQGVADGKWTTRHQTVLKPDVFHPAYIEFLNIENINQAASDILGSNEIVFGGLACLLGAPRNQYCKWHRDFSDDHPELNDLLADPCLAIQYNAAVYDDSCLWIVPGSHRRHSLDNEKAYAKRFSSLEFISERDDALSIDPNIMAGMPGSMNVQLEAGDIALYNNQLWHSAEYTASQKRATLHGGYKLQKNMEKYESSRWGLDHNPWLAYPDYMDDLGPIFSKQLDRHIALTREFCPA